MLERILIEIRDAGAPVTLGMLARRVDTPVSALEPMIRALENAGLLGPEAGTGMSCVTQCGSNCNPEACPLTVSLPTPLLVTGA